jgi:hypothetical protein
MCLYQVQYWQAVLLAQAAQHPAGSTVENRAESGRMSEPEMVVSFRTWQLPARASPSAAADAAPRLARPAARRREAMSFRGHLLEFEQNLFELRVAFLCQGW